MTNRTVTTYYKYLSLVTLLVSVVGSITLVDGTTIEKLGIGTLLNLQFHLAFQSISRLPMGFYTLLEDDKTWRRRLLPKALKFISIFFMVASVFAFIGMLNSVKASHDYSQLMVTMTFLAMFLGGLSLKLKVREI